MRIVKWSVINTVSVVVGVGLAFGIFHRQRAAFAQQNGIAHAGVTSCPVSDRGKVGTKRDWRPKSDEPYVVGDERFAALQAYRDARVVMHVYSYIETHREGPDDDEDLLYDFQGIAAGYLFKALDFLASYPDSELLTELLRFQQGKIAGGCTPWGVLKLRLFREQSESFSKFFSELTSDQKTKLAGEIRDEFAMATDPNSWLAYRIPTAEVEGLRRRIDELPK